MVVYALPMNSKSAAKTWPCLNSQILQKYRLNVVGVADLKTIVDENRQNYILTQLVELPTLIADFSQLYCFEQTASQPNYVTTHSVEAELVVVEENGEIDLQGCIALIPRADPGYDWLFGSGIAGLITMYGGANSHMAIRAAEIGLPAVIGVGEKRYADIARLGRIQLDCGNQIIREIG